MHRNSLRAFLCLTTLGLLASPTLAQNSSVNRLPPGVNAAAVVDVQALLKTKLAEKEGWRAKLATGYGRPIAAPPTAKTITMAAFIQPDTFEPQWQSSIIELGGPANLAAIARAQQGYTEEIAGKKAVRTGGDAYYVQLDNESLGVFWPAQRQRVAKWVELNATSTQAPAYLRDAIGKAGEVGQITIAMDLNNAYSTAQVFQSMARGSFKSLDKFDGDVAVLSEKIAKIKGLVITVNVTEEINVLIRADFDLEPTIMTPFAKELAREMLTDFGLPVNDIKDWEVKAVGSSVVASGKLSLAGMQHLLMPFEPPAPWTTGGGGETGMANEPAKVEPLDPAKASQAYYQAIVKILDNIQVQQASMQMTANVFKGQARRIDNLPILNVDPVLLAWGSRVSEALMRGVQLAAVGQQRAIAASSGVASPVAYTNDNEYYENGYNNTATAETRAAFRNVQGQRRSMGEQARADTLNDVATLINDVNSQRGKIRAEMVQKYGVEF
jgi:hypothetical protein